MTTYQYFPLRGPSEIRVLQINSAVDDTESLSGRLVTVDLDENPEYDALSYTWGSPDLCSKITLNSSGGSLAITANLDLALRRMRARTPPGMLTCIWADGICINQTDIPERNQQVGLMRRIYSQCELGLIYLGEEADGSDEVPEFFGRLAPGRASINGNTEHWHENELLPDEDDQGWQALHSLLERPWFLRVWIIQEFALPRESRMICGDWELDADLLPQITTMPTMNHSRQAMQGLQVVEGSDFAKAWTHQSLMLRCKDSIGQSLVHTQSDAFSKNAVGLMELLWACRQCNATDPRDHYFALLSLAPDVAYEPNIAADYGKKLEDVAIDYGRYFVKYGLGSTILYLSNDAGTRAEYLPSWLPDFTRSSLAGDKIWWPSADKQHGINITMGGTDLRSLLVNGCILDAVVEMGSEKDMESGNLDHWRDDWIKEIDSLVAGIEFYPSGENVDEAVCRTIIANKSLERQRPAPEYYYHMYLLCRKVGTRSFVIQGLPLEEVQKLHETVEAAKSFDMAVSMLANSRFCVTKDGFFGMVPRNTKPGDLIFTMQGDEERATFIVRKNATLNSYQWIGHAYIHDIWVVREYEDLTWEVITVD